MYFIVFGARRTGEHLEWSGPIAVFSADSGEEACQAAAKKVGWMGSFFAVEGSPWGVELMETQAEEFGAADAEKPVPNLERLERRTRELERSVGIGE